MNPLDLRRFGVFPALPDGSPSGLSSPKSAESPADQELSNSLAWLIRLRWMAASGLVLATLVASRAGLAIPRGPLLLVALGILVYNAVFHLAPGRLPGDPLRSLVARQWFARLQIGADWLATAVLIHYTGGIESPAILFYLFHITIASLLLPHDRGFLYVALAPVLVGSVALAEYLGWLPHVPFAARSSAAYARAGHVAAVLAIFTGSAYAMAVCSMSVSRRLRRREHEIAGLYESVRLTTSTLDLSLVLERLTEAVVKALRCKAASIRLLDRTGRVDMVAMHGLSDAYQGKASMDLAKALVDREVLTGKVVLVSDVATDPRVYHPQAVRDEGISSMLCAPLLGKRGAIGVLRAYGAEGHQFGTDDGAFLLAIGAHGAVAIENADAYRALQALDHEKSRFVRIVTHELRSPLQVTQNLMAVLRGGYTGALNERQADLVDRACHRVAFLETLVDDLLNLAAGRTDVRAERPGLGLVSLAGVVTKVCARFEPACRQRGLWLRVMPAGATLSVSSDAASIDRIADNLVGNAVKYTRAGGVIVALERQDDFARLAVTDTGIGIPSDEQPRLFEEFFRARNAREVEEHGTGLGLAIARDLVMRHGGRIAIESAEGEGTTVTVLLPLAREDAACPADARAGLDGRSART
ncbi:MAG TPA: GAF domain-containing sensor histidine kinase [Vicinamibacterales bacterium]|nr:GAF domain-containing sensor histidine kinase [Vicinamibacterales bacterium]